MKLKNDNNRNEYKSVTKLEKEHTWKVIKAVGELIM